MTLEEIKNRITFQAIENGGHGKMMIARLELGASSSYDDRHSNNPEYTRHIKDNLSEVIIRSLYEDRTREIMEAIRGILMASPMDMQEVYKSTDKLARLCQKMPLVQYEVA